MDDPLNPGRAVQSKVNVRVDELSLESVRRPDVGGGDTVYNKHPAHTWLRV